jgi:hypothetical protein
MRIAVIVFGRLNKCVEHYNNIIESLGENNNIDFFASSDNSSESLLSDFVNLYKPVMYNNSPINYDFDLGKYPGKRVETNIHTMTCMFINKNRVLRLLEEYINVNNIQYDCVVSLRIDCVFQNKFDFNFLEDNTIYIPSGFDYLENAINDQIAYGKIDVMKKYNSINGVDLLEKNLSIPHAESLNYANLKFYKLNIVRPCINYYLDR